MLTLVLTRHGLTDRSTPEQHLGQRIDVSINEAGRRQAEALARRLAPVAFDRAFTSPLFRARETAAIVVRSVEVEADPRLREMDYGAWEGRTYEQIREADGAYREAWERDPDTLAVPRRRVRERRRGARPRLPRRPAGRAPGVAREGVVPRRDLGLGRRRPPASSGRSSRLPTPRPTGSSCASRWTSRSASSGGA